MNELMCRFISRQLVRVVRGTGSQSGDFWVFLWMGK